MRLLLVNDDGITAPGIRLLAHRLAADGHDVTMAAPDRQHSGSGTSVGHELNGLLIPTVVSESTEPPGIHMIAVGGPPALVALAACHGLVDRPPDLVISGINPGHNVGRLTLHSGTLAAATTAAAYGWPAVAVSCPGSPNERYEEASEFIAAAVETLAVGPVRRPVLNINFPHRELGDVRGVRHAALAMPPAEVSLEREATGFRVRVSRPLETVAEDSDLALLHHGWITVTHAPALHSPPGDLSVVDRLAALLR